MVRLVPEQPRFTTTSEQEVWRRLKAGLGSDDVLLANVRLTDQDKDHEADLIVLMPEVGIVVIEVKGGSVWHDEDGWWQTRRGERARIDPVEQVRTCKYALRSYVSRDPRWHGRYVAWGHAIVTPYSDFAADAESPDCPRWSLHDRGDQVDLVNRLVANAKKSWQGKPAPSVEDVDVMVDILAGRLNSSYDLNADAEDRAAEAERLTLEQANLLKVTRLLHRVEVRGGAGSGKTVLALQQAKELTRGHSGERKSQRVALICYSIGLAEFLKRQVAAWPRNHRPAFVGTFHEYGRQWGADDGDRQDSRFWEETLPEQMGDLAEQLTDNLKYDAVIVDEAQDFADTWWRPVLKSLRDEKDGGLYIYSDENQRIFARFGRPPVALIPLVLDHNLRNTRQIHDSFGPLAPSRMYSSGGEGPAVRFVPSSGEDALGVADDEVDRLIDAGWRPENICLLTTGRRHPEQGAQTDRLGQVGYWRSFWDGEDVFYGHVLGSKGLERRAVVLCLNESGDRDRARERLYVGMSRATDMLVVVGAPDVVRRVGGDQVARRLGISE